MKRRRARWRVIAGVAVGAWIAVLVVLLCVLLANPSLLQTHDVLVAAPVIAVLNGDTFSRVEKGLALFRAHYGSEIWLTGDPTVGAEADGGTDSNRRCLRETHGLSDSNLRILDHRISTVEERLVTGVFGTTAIELAMIEREMARRDIRQIIIVTSRQHGRRVRALWALGPSRWFRRAIIQHPETDAYRNPRQEAVMTLVAWSVPWSLIMTVREAMRMDEGASLPVPPTHFVCKGDGAPTPVR